MDYNELMEPVKPFFDFLYIPKIANLPKVNSHCVSHHLLIKVIKLLLTGVLWVTIRWKQKIKNLSWIAL